VRFANTAGNQLRVLGPEVENEDSIVPKFHPNPLGVRGEG